jgi:hypothetical protein
MYIVFHFICTSYYVKYDTYIISYFVYKICVGGNIKYIVLFLDHPNENIPIEPQIDDQLNLRLNTTFRKVFPKPICQAHINVRYLFIVKPPTQILYTK